MLIGRCVAGNDLRSLYRPNTTQEAYHKFMTTQNLFLARLYNTRLATGQSCRPICTIIEAVARPLQSCP